MAWGISAPEGPLRTLTSLLSFRSEPADCSWLNGLSTILGVLLPSGWPVQAGFWPGRSLPLFSLTRTVIPDILLEVKQ